MFVIDLDKFKEVNDLFGYFVGDMFFKEVVVRLLKVVVLLVELICIGGDEFIIWVFDISIDGVEDLV